MAILEHEAIKNIVDRLHKLFEQADHISFGALGILRTALRRFHRLRGTEGAASLAFYSLFSLFPLILVLVWIGSHFLQSQTVQDQIFQVVRMAIPVSADAVIGNIRLALANNTAIGLVGLIGLAWAATGALSTLTSQIDRAWPTARPRRFLENRLIAFGMLLALVGLLAISTLATATLQVIASLSPVTLSEIPFWGDFIHSMTILVGFVLFLVIYRWLPKTRVRWKAAIGAAVVATLAWQISARAFAWYLSTDLPNYTLIYGTIGTIVALMTWIYLNCLIIIFCAHLSAAIMHRS